MFEFWDKKHIKKTAKEHQCGYCFITIPAGSECFHEAGKPDYDDFYSRYLCPRCSELLDCNPNDLFHDGEYLQEFGIALGELDLTECPTCGSKSTYSEDMSEDGLVLHCICEMCDTKYDVDISAKALLKKAGWPVSEKEDSLKK